MNNCPNCNSPYQTGDEVCRTCGFILPITSPTISAGEVLQTRYEIQELLHSGGMGYVYLASDKRLYDRFCIVKQVKEPIKSDDHRKKLEEEALRMAKLDHPNVAMILDHFIDGGYYFLVVERIHGKTLSQVLKERRGHLTENEVVTWAVSICDVVSYLHSEGIVHRDISPDNIMLTGEGSIKFIDFGTLREFRYIAPGGTVGIGKYGYTPPEQWQGKPEFRSDIFALGATLYYLLTGFLPLSREYTTRQAPQKDDFNPTFPPIRTKSPSVSPQLEAVLQKALQLDVNDRYASAKEFGEALRNMGKIEIKSIPILSLETGHLDFASVKHGSTVTKPLILRNTGTDKLAGKLTTTQPWLKVSPNKIDVKSGEWKGKVTVNTRRLTPGFYGAGEININTNGGQAKVAVDLSIAPEVKPEVISKPKPISAPKPISKPKPIRISKPKARMPLRWALISLGIVLFLIAGGSGIYFASGHPFTPPSTSSPETTTPLPDTTVLPPDTTPPLISDVNVAGYTGETATIIWETDDDATGQVEYGTTDAYGKPAASDGELTTGHSVELTGLQPNTTYHFRIKSTDRSGNEAGSGDQAFTTWVAEKDWKEYVNKEYGFSVKYPKDWVERPDLITSPRYLAAFGVDQRLSLHNFRGVIIAVDKADQPMSNDWIVASLQKTGNTNVKVVSPLTETTLPDGAKATTYEATYWTVAKPEIITAIGLNADKVDKRISVIVFTEEAYLIDSVDNRKLFSLDKKLFSEIAHTLTFKDMGVPPAPPATQPTPAPQPTPATPPAEKPAEQTPPAELSFKAKTYTNDQYGFSIQYPKEWVARPELITVPGTHLSAFGVEGYVPGVVLYVFAADEPESKEWVVKSFKSTGNIMPKVTSGIKEETLADGTKAYTYTADYVSATGYQVTSYCIDADRGDKRVRANVFTIETFEPYNKPLASEIAHTLRFTQ